MTGAPPNVPRVALVLGAKVMANGEASPALRRRTEHAAALWHAGKVDLILVSGGMPRAGRREAHVMADLLTAAHIPGTQILREDQARNTWENLAFSQALLPEGAKIVLVTERYHAHRARLIARRQGITATIDCPSDHDTPWKRRLKTRLRECAALLYFFVFGARR